MVNHPFDQGSLGTRGFVHHFTTKNHSVNGASDCRSARMQGPPPLWQHPRGRSEGAQNPKGQVSRLVSRLVSQQFLDWMTLALAQTHLHRLYSFSTVRLVSKTRSSNLTIKAQQSNRVIYWTSRPQNYYSPESKKRLTGQPGQVTQIRFETRNFVQPRPVLLEANLQSLPTLPERRPPCPTASACTPSKHPPGQAPRGRDQRLPLQAGALPVRIRGGQNVR